MKDDRRLFTLLLPSEDLPKEKTMYYRIENGTALHRDGALLFPAASALSFDCYYNVFDYAVFRDDTTIDRVFYVLSLQGDLTLRLSLLRKGKNEKECETIPLSETAFRSTEPTQVRIPLSLSALEGNGTIFLAIDAHSDGAFLGGYIEAENAPRQDVKIGVAITTFRREPFVRANVAKMTRDLPSDVFSVFVTDNGNTLTPEDVAGANLIPNKNLGGSSGFARGMMEITAQGGFTHILLTDDDISFESEVFLRTAALLRYAKEPDNVIVGASMLFSDEPNFQNELGAKWTGHRQIPNNFFYLKDHLSLVKNANHPHADYSGWWYNCIPASLPERVGLPFPFFIKVDDAEYCIRSHAKILLLNGIGVLHECFNHKYQASLEYYHTRNGLILNALHYPRRGALYHFGTLLRDVAKEMISQRYRTSELIFRAFDDFLRGADAYAAIDAAALHRELASLGERQISRAELEAQGYALTAPLSRDKKGVYPLSFKQVVTLNGYLLPAKKEPYRVVDLTATKADFFYRARRVVQYNPYTEKGFVTEQKRGVLCRTLFRLVGYFFKLLFRHRKASRSFRKAFPELVSNAAWKRRLEIE